MRKFYWTFFCLKRQFKKQGYANVTTNELREFVQSFLWKRHMPNTWKQQKESILSITPNLYFDYKAMMIQKQPTIPLSEIDFTKL